MVQKIWRLYKMKPDFAPLTKPPYIQIVIMAKISYNGEN